MFERQSPSRPGVIRASIVIALHFGHGGLYNVLMMQSLASGGSAILSVTG
jgi:hypothetical protein